MAPYTLTLERVDSQRRIVARLHTGGDEPELPAAAVEDDTLLPAEGPDPAFFGSPVAPVLVPVSPLVVQRQPPVPNSLDTEVSGQDVLVRLLGRESLNVPGGRNLPLGNEVL